MVSMTKEIGFMSHVGTVAISLPSQLLAEIIIKNPTALHFFRL